MTTPLRPRSARGGSASRRSRLQIVLLGLGGLVAVNLLVIAMSLGGQDQRPPLPPEIEAVIPAPHTTIRLQEDVGARLLDHYTGRLFINGVEIPSDQLRIEPALGLVTFRPGDGKDITRFAPGLHTATIEYWPQDKTREQGSQSFSWQFIAG